MMLFACPACASIVSFEDRGCASCGGRVGFDAARMAMAAPSPAGPGAGLRFCANAEHDVCNWLVASDGTARFCRACRHNRIVPARRDPSQLERWRRLEIAKHRMIYSLLRLGVALPNRGDDPEGGLAFDFLDEFPGGPRVLTGHDSGLVTIAAREADDAFREAQRAQMREPYRTLLGHFRHEIGHWIWDRLVRDAGELDRCRALFGDDRADYAEALRRHYEHGPPADWPARFISAYATAHPWEDFAETWAHYLHIMDTLETASAFRMSVDPAAAPDRALSTTIDLDPYATDDFDRIVARWPPLVLAVNSLNRSMGIADLYPFAITGPMRGKLAFLHRIARAGRENAGPGSPGPASDAAR